MEIIAVKGNTHLIDTGMTYIPFYKINEKEIIMLDTGWAAGERNGIQEALDHEQLRVAGIISSHAHVDHIGNNSYFQEKYNCVLAMHKVEAALCSSIYNLKFFFSGHPLDEVKRHYGNMVCQADILIQENQQSVKVCNVEFGLFHNPGHSPAHMCIITPDDVAYVGDGLVSHDVMEGSKMPYANVLSEDLESKEKLHELVCSKYIIAHKGIYDSIQLLIEDNIAFYRSCAQSVLAVINHPMSMEEITKAVMNTLGITAKSVNKYMAIEKMLRSNIEYLQETKMIELSVEDGFLKYTKCN